MPSFGFVISSDLILDVLPGISFEQNSDLRSSPLLLTVAVIGCSLVLLAVNIKLIRLLEGYGDWNPLRLVLRRQKRRYRGLHGELENIDKTETTDKNRAETTDGRKAALLRQLSTQFPDQERYVLPTRFGNIIRAFEVYPRVMYGLEGVQGWDRVYLLLSKENRVEISNVKAQVDLWVNIVILTSILLTEYTISAMVNWKFGDLWIPGILILTIWFAKRSSENAALEWGELVKSVFDVFLGDLQDKLELPIIESESEQRELWKRFSQAVIYRRPDVLPKRVHMPTDENDD